MLFVRPSVRPSVRASVRPYAVPTNLQILGKNLEIRSKFWFESSKAQNMRAGRVDKN